MDRVGTYMCLATIPMALLTIAGAGAGLVLLAFGDWRLVAVGSLAFGFCSLLAPVLERAVILLDEAAASMLAQQGRKSANLLAIASGAVPVAVILGWEIVCFRDFNGASGGLVLARWLWSYGIATGPWTTYAMRVSRFRRTLVGIRAYAGHLAYWLLSMLTMAVALPVAVAVPFMLLPAILPFTVGMLLAVADREALTNVRV